MFVCQYNIQEGVFRKVGCRFHLLLFNSRPKMPDEESPVPPGLRNYKFVVIQVEEENSELKPGFYLSSLTPKEVWEKL